MDISRFVNADLAPRSSQGSLDKGVLRQALSEVRRKLGDLDLVERDLKNRLAQVGEEKEPLLKAAEALVAVLGDTDGGDGNVFAGESPLRSGSGRISPELAPYVKIQDDGTVKPKTAEIILATIEERGPLTRLELVSAVLDRFGPELAAFWKDAEDTLSVSARRRLQNGELVKLDDERYALPSTKGGA